MSQSILKHGDGIIIMLGVANVPSLIRIGKPRLVGLFHIVNRRVGYLNELLFYSGGHVATNLPGVIPMKPGSCGMPFFGIEFEVMDSKTGQTCMSL